ncbi:MAG TPA: hypothetical protein VGM11_07660 [Acidobacteriaceae bacterium]|jgi:hypothetical protein
MSPLKKKQEIEKELEQRIVIPEVPADEHSKQVAEKTLAKESKFYEEERKAELHKQDVADRQSDRTQREKYAGRVFSLVLAWIILMFVLLMFQGFCELIHFKPLSDKVLLALITSTTVNLIGTLIIVLKYIFRTAGNSRPVSSTKMRK